MPLLLFILLRMQNKVFQFMIGILIGIWMGLLILILYFVYDTDRHFMSMDNQLQQFATVDDLKSLTK